MKSFVQYPAIIFTLLIILRSSSASQELNAALSPATLARPGEPIPYSIQDKQSALLEQAKPWTPRFVQTDGASGIMIEFTGMKKNKRLNARHAGIELLRYPADATTKAIRLGALINDLRQAFFEVTPGKYLVRQTKTWADASYIRDVEVQEGSYSTILIDVFNPRLTRPR